MSEFYQMFVFITCTHSCKYGNLTLGIRNLIVSIHLNKDGPNPQRYSEKKFILQKEIVCTCLVNIERNTYQNKFFFRIDPLSATTATHKCVL